MNNLKLMALFSLLLCGCAVSRVEPLSVPLVYNQNAKNSNLAGAFSCNTLSQLQVSDARADKTLGVRSHESKPLKADVTAGSDAGAWVRDGMQSYFTQNGLTVQDKGPKLLVTIDSLRTKESIWHRSTYDATIALTGRLVSPGGKECWKETTQGMSSNYGYSGSIENYQETLNSALDTATGNLARLQGFKDALCKCAD